MAWTEKYVSVAGGGAHDGSSEANAWTLAEAVAGVAAGNRVNVKAGTYASTTTVHTLATAGSTTAPIWWRGYQTTIGDMDDAAHGTFLAGTSVPALTFASGRISVTGVYQIFSNLDVYGTQNSNAQFILTAANGQVDRCRIECASANSSGRALTVSGSESVVSRSWMKSASSAEVVTTGGSGVVLAGCVLEGGANGIVFTGGISIVYRCVFNNCGGDAVRQTTATRLYLLGCSVYSPGSDGVEFTVAPTRAVVADTIFSECLYGVNNSSGTNTAHVVRLHNDFHSMTSGTVAGLGDTPALAAQSDASSPFANAAGGDLTPASGSNARGNGLPGAFEGQSYTTHADIGAVQHADAGGGGGAGFVPPAGGHSGIWSS